MDREMVDMDIYDNTLRDINATRIVAKTGAKIIFAGMEFNLEPNGEISIWKERPKNPELDLICRATSPGGKYPDGSVVLSRVDWSCSKGAKLEISYDGERELCKTLEINV